MRKIFLYCQNVGKSRVMKFKIKIRVVLALLSTYTFISELMHLLVGIYILILSRFEKFLLLFFRCVFVLSIL